MAITDRLSLAHLPSLGTVTSTALKVKNGLQSRLQSFLTKRSEAPVGSPSQSPVEEQDVREVHAEPLNLHENDLDPAPVFTKVPKKPRRSPPKKAAAKDLAHAPGHRKLDHKGDVTASTGTKVKTQKSAQNRMAESDRIGRNQSPMKRVAGAAGRRRQGGSKNLHH